MKGQFIIFHTLKQCLINFFPAGPCAVHFGRLQGIIGRYVTTDIANLKKKSTERDYIFERIIPTIFSYRVIVKSV